MRLRYLSLTNMPHNGTVYLLLCSEQTNELTLIPPGHTKMDIFKFLTSCGFDIHQRETDISFIVNLHCMNRSHPS